MVAYQDDFVTLHQGTAIEVLRGMPEKSVHMCVTSPPYWGLRSYLPADHPAKGQEIGTEKTPDEFVAKLVEVFAEVWRVLRDDGQLWVNIGDSYVSSPPGNSTLGVSAKSKLHGANGPSDKYRQTLANGHATKRDTTGSGLKPKDLCMIPARLAIALCDWGWYLRQELVWAKDSCMPESVRDRCTRAHEFVYMLTKKPTYFYDSEAIKEPFADSRNGNPGNYHSSHREAGLNPTYGGFGKAWNEDGSASGRNARSVWRINPKPYPGSHFAVFPPELPMRCIKAGTSERGVCSECGAPWRRVVTSKSASADSPREWQGIPLHQSNRNGRTQEPKKRGAVGTPEVQAVGWEPTCTHEAATVPATVLDPFMGSGTTALAARRLGRRSVGIDLDPKSADLLEDRLGHQGVLL